MGLPVVRAGGRVVGARVNEGSWPCGWRACTTPLVCTCVRDGQAGGVALLLFWCPKGTQFERAGGCCPRGTMLDSCAFIDLAMFTEVTTSSIRNYGSSSLIGIGFHCWLDELAMPGMLHVATSRRYSPHARHDLFPDTARILLPPPPHHASTLPSLHPPIYPVHTNLAPCILSLFTLYPLLPLPLPLPLPLHTSPNPRGQPTTQTAANTAPSARLDLASCTTSLCLPER